MNTKQPTAQLVARALAVALIISAPSLLAAPQGAPPGYGMGPGMMGGYGNGPGTMGNYGMGPGAMGGYGMGPGMMGDNGMGPGMMNGFWASDLGLSDEQEARISRIQDETRKTHWALMGTMMDQQAKLRDLYSAPKRDAAAIDNAYKAIGLLRQEMYDTSVEAQKRMEAVLSKEQQEKLRNYSRRGRMPVR